MTVEQAYKLISENNALRKENAELRGLLKEWHDFRWEVHGKCQSKSKSATAYNDLCIRTGIALTEAEEG